MQRACAAAMVSIGKSIIKNPGHSNDDKAAIAIIQNMGAQVELNGDEMIVTSNGVDPSTGEINCGESGLGIRMFAPLVALSSRAITINGKGSLLTRPMDFFDEVLPQLGVTITSSNGRLPLQVKGPLVPKDIEIDGSLSSQFLTGLLMAYAAAGASNVSIKVNNLKSRPYIDLTLDVMKQFNLQVPENSNYEVFHYRGDAGYRIPDAALTHVSRLTTHEYTVEGDWSGGAFLLVAGAIAGPITIHGLDMNSTQADKEIVNALMDAGAGIAIEAKAIKMHPAAMRAFEFDATDCPDLFPPLVALAAYCKGTTTIKGVSRLTHKESNRALTLQEEFGKMGILIELDNDNMIIHGGKGVQGVTVHSHNDHRIAMACAVAGLKAGGDTVIQQAMAVSKSYPDFYHDLKKLGIPLAIPGGSFTITSENE